MKYASVSQFDPMVRMPTKLGTTPAKCQVRNASIDCPAREQDMAKTEDVSF